LTHLEHKLEELVSNLGPVLELGAEDTPAKKKKKYYNEKKEKNTTKKVKCWGLTSNALIRVLLVEN
jgi:hypothetical protein